MNAEQRATTFADFAAAIVSRLEKGAAVYGDRSFELPPAALVREISEELLDVCAWSFILWSRLRRIPQLEERAP